MFIFRVLPDGKGRGGVVTAGTYAGGLDTSMTTAAICERLFNGTKELSMCSISAAVFGLPLFLGGFGIGVHFPGPNQKMP